MPRQPIIAGIDPGTTLGFAILDIEGNLQKIGSGKEISLADLIRTITEIGNVVAVGCDKKNTPSFVARFAVKVGARIISPRQDLLVAEKKELIRQIDTHQNAHQLDALASAMFAYQSLRPILRKIRIFIEREQKSSIADSLYDLVICKELSIRYAADLLEKKETPELVIVREAVTTKNYSPESFFNLYSRFREKEALAKHWKREYARTKKLLNKARKDLSSRPKTEIEPRKIDLWNERWESRFKEAKRGKEAMKKTIDAQKRTIDRLESAMLSQHSYLVLHRSKDLGASFSPDHLEKQAIFIENPHIFSRSVLESLAKKDILLISDRTFPGAVSSHLPSLVVETCQRFKRFVLVRKSVIEQARHKQDTLRRIITQYKESRQGRR